MAKNNSLETPLSMPKLPDLDQDLFGAGSGAIFNQPDDLLNPKAVAPLGAQQGKLSPAAQALASAQREQNDLLNYATEQQQKIQQQEARQQAAFDRQQAAQRRETDAAIRQYQRDKKEREKALKEKAKEQGGVLGAGADGSFVLKPMVETILADKKWKDIKSSFQREDEAQGWLKEKAVQLKEQGIPEDLINNELRVAGALFKQDTDAYTKQRSEDRADPLDAVSWLGKAGRNLYKGTVLWLSPVWNKTIGKTGLTFDTEEFVREQNDAINSIDSTLSDKIHFAQENNEYLTQKRRAQGKDGLVAGFTGGIADMWKADNMLYTMLDSAAYIPYSAAVGSGAGAFASRVGAATRLTPAIEGITARVNAAAAAPGASLATRIGAKAASRLLSSEVAGGMATTGFFAATDAAGGAYDAVYNQDEDTFRQTYIKANGEENWNNLVQYYGSAGKARAALAEQAAVSAGNAAFINTALLGAAGLETTLLKANKFGLQTFAGKRLATAGANSVSELLEEGLTQYSQNVGSQPATGVDLLEGVPEAAAIGFVAGGSMAGGTQVLGALGKGVKNYVAPEFDAARLDPTQYVHQNQLDYDSYRQVVGREMDNIARTGRRAKWHETDIGSAQQMAYDTIIDDPSKWEAFTPDQRAQMQEYLKQAYNINTNPYAQVERQTLTDIWENGDTHVLNAWLQSEEKGIGEDIRNAFRVKHGVELENVPDGVRAYSEALANAIDHQIAAPVLRDTNEQWKAMRDYVKTQVETNPTLTREQQKGIDAILANYLDAGRRRLTDEQVAAAAQTQPTGQPDEPANPGAGQGAPTQNNQPVAGESGAAPAAGAGSTGGETQSVGQPDAAPAGGANPQSAGVDNAQQGNQPGGGTDAPAQTVQPAGGAAQAPTSGAQPGVTAPAGNAGQTPAGQGATGQTSTTGQPAQPLNPGTAPQTGSSGSAGAATPERNPNGGSNQAATQAVGVTGAYSPQADLRDASHAWAQLSKAQKSALAKIGISTPAQLLDILKNADTVAEAGQRLARTGRVRSMTMKSVQDALKAARDYITSPEWVFNKLTQDQLGLSANEASIPAAVAALQSSDEITTRKISQLAKGAAEIYGLEDASKEDKIAYAAKLLLDIAQLAKTSPQLLDVAMRLKGAPESWFQDDVDKLLKNDIWATLQSAPGIFEQAGVDFSQSRPNVTQSQQNLWSARAVLFTLKQNIKAGDARSKAVQAGLDKAAKRITDMGGEKGRLSLLFSMLEADSRGEDLTGFLENYYIGSRASADAIAGVIRAYQDAKAYMASPDFQNSLRADNWLRQADKSVYTQAIRDYVRNNYAAFNQMLIQDAEVASGKSARTRVADTNFETQVVNTDILADVLADVVHNTARLGREYAGEIARSYAGRDENGNRVIKPSAVKRFLEQADTIAANLRQQYLDGKLAQQPTQSEDESEQLAQQGDDLSRLMEEFNAGQQPDDDAVMGDFDDAVRGIPTQPHNGEKQIKNGGFDSPEAAEDALSTELFQHPETVEELDELLQSIAEATGLDPLLVGEYIAREWLSQSEEDYADASTDELLDMVYDAANDIWIYAGEQNATQQIADTKRLEGPRSITADGQRITRQSQDPTGSLARALQPNLSGGAYAQLARPSQPAPARLAIAPVEEIVAEFGGQEFSLAEIIENTENQRGDRSPTLGELAPEDNNAPRPVIELTVNGVKHRGRLFRWRDRKNGHNRRHVVFVHDGDAFGMRGWDDKWIDFGNAVTRKRVDSINQNDGIRIEVLADQSESQEQTNDKTEKRTQRTGRSETEDENNSGIVGDVRDADVTARGSDVTDAGADESEQDEGSGQSDESERGSGAAEGRLETPAPVDVPQGLDYTPEQVAEIDPASLTADERAALNRQDDTHEFVANALYGIAGALEDFGGVDSAALRSGLAKMAALLADPAAPRRTTQTTVSEQAAGRKDVADVITDEERDILDAYLDDIGNTEQSAEEFAEEAVADNQFENSSLPKKVRAVLERIWNALRNGMAAVSMALAVHLGSSMVVSQPAEAANLTPQAGEVVMSSAAKASLDHIIDTADNGGRPFVIADKKAGKLYLMNAEGKVVDTTPALFGKTPSDAAKTAGATGAGKYDLTYNRDTRLPSGYAGSVQSFDTGTNGDQFAIHRVIDVKGQNRQSRLDSKTARDNRITLGCINVPAEFYDAHLDNDLGAVLYVLPETANWGGDLYDKTPRQAAQPTPQAVKIATEGTSLTPEQLLAATRSQADSLIASVRGSMDNASYQPVQVTPEQLQAATEAGRKVTTQPVQAQAPIQIAGVQPSTQTAYISPVMVNGVSANTLVVPFKAHTPAEMQANGVFDTQPVGNKTKDGDSLYTIASWLAAAFAAGKVNSRRKKRLESRKKANEERLARIEAKNNPELKSEPEDTSVVPDEAEAETAVADNHDVQASFAKQAGTHNPQTPLAQAVAQAVRQQSVLENKAEWIHAFAMRYSSDEAQYQQLLAMMGNLEYNLGGVLTDRSYTQSGDFRDRRRWRGDQTDASRVGMLQAFMRFAGGATVAFDNLLHRVGSAAFGHEADSAIASKMLSQVRAKSSGAYAQLHKTLIHPLVMQTATLASQMRRGHGEIETDTGRTATLNHILNEGAEQMWKGAELEIAKMKLDLQEVEAQIRSTAAGSQIQQTWTSKQLQLLKDIDAAQTLLDRQRDMYYGREEWDGTTDLPGGYTEAQAKTELQALKDKYGEDFAKIEAHSKELVQTIQGIRNFAAAAGVVTNDQLAMYNEMGFKEYVPLYSPQEDVSKTDESTSIMQTSRMDRLLEGIPLAQAKSMGLTRDLSRFKRKGATSPAEDAYTNMKVYAMNTAGRVGQQGWLQAVQQLYEGTIGKPYSVAGNLGEETLKELNSQPEGKLPGLIRVRPGMEDYLPAHLQTAIAAPGGRIRAIRAKGYNSAGELVDYHYYFTDKAIQQEVYYTSDTSESFMMRIGRNAGTITRFAARMMTTFRPVWNVYNWVRDSIERISIMIARPVKDKNGDLINRWTLAKTYASHLARLASSLEAQNEIMRYLSTGELVTELQRTLDEAVGEGAINLMTTQTDKHSVMSDLRKSDLDRLLDTTSRMLGTTANKLGVGQGKAWLGDIAEYYVQRMTEVPQVTTALASYLAYRELGVNKHERANRVRDQYDPTRTRSEIVRGLSTMYPFVRSTFSGHYNLMRTLSEYWNPGERGFTTLYLAGGTAAMMAILALAAGAIGDDDDGVPLVARMPIGTLMNGIPIRTPDGGVWSAPVGFGMPKLMWGTAVNLYRLAYGEQSASDMSRSMLGLVMDNTSPVQVASGAAFDRDVGAGAALSFAPLLAVPFVEMMTNTKAYTGQKIYNRETPRGERDADQGGFNIPEAYKDTAQALTGMGIDVRPETLKHLLETFSYGPLKAIPTSLLADKSEKYLGNRETKGEAAGALVTAIGMDMAWSPHALDDEARVYQMLDDIYPILGRYGITEISHDKSEYKRFGIEGRENRKARLLYAKMVAAGAPEWEASFVRDAVIHKTSRQKAIKEFQAGSEAYLKAKANGEENEQLRAALENQWDAIENSDQNFLRQYNEDAYEMQDDY